MYRDISKVHRDMLSSLKNHQIVNFSINKYISSILKVDVPQSKLV